MKFQEEHQLILGDLFKVGLEAPTYPYAERAFAKWESAGVFVYRSETEARCECPQAFVAEYDEPFYGICELFRLKDGLRVGCVGDKVLERGGTHVYFLC